tara:strand:- start:49991 stop:50941 length:951 start_codon:yes stop_codon:yes gene_type:complete
MSSTKLLKTAVIGVGYLGRFHAQKHKALAELCELQAVVDASSDRAKQVAEELGVEAVADYRSLAGKVDAVTVASTTSTHFEISKFFIENGIHVNVEKPMTVTSQEAEELCQLAEKHNVKLQVGHIERFNPALIAAQDKIRDPLFIEVSRLAEFKPRGVDVSVVLDLMIHDLDVILSMVNSPVSSVQSVGTPVITGTDDICNARIEFENGCVANVTASRVSKEGQRKFRVFQKDTYMSVDFGAGGVSVITKTGEGIDPVPLDIENWNLEKGDALLDETRSFLQSIINDEPCVVTGKDGLQALQLAETIIAANESRRR